MKKLYIDKDKLLKLTPTKNPFQSLTRSIIFQQLSGKEAGAILKKFIALWSTKSAERIGRSQKRINQKKFPKPEEVLMCSDEELRSSGLSRGKVVYIKDLATKFLDSSIAPHRFKTMSDQNIIDHLVKVKGIGTWTAHMFLIFGLNRSNILPTGDLAIKKDFKKYSNFPLFRPKKK